MATKKTVWEEKELATNARQRATRRKETKTTKIERKREANRRHQQSDEGRIDHRDRQRAYRQRATKIEDVLAGLEMAVDGERPTDGTALYKDALVLLDRTNDALSFLSALARDLAGDRAFEAYDRGDWAGLAADLRAHVRAMQTGSKPRG